jgi:hypothetical protein
VAYLTVAFSVAVVALGLLLLVLCYAAHTHSAARWAEAIDAHNLTVARWDESRRAFVAWEDDAA